MCGVMVPIIFATSILMLFMPLIVCTAVGMIFFSGGNFLLC